MANDNCSIFKMDFADCKRRAIIWISALGKSGEPQDLLKVALTAQERVDTALKSAQFLQNAWETSPQFKKLQEAGEKLGKIAAYYQKAKKIEKNYDALKQVYEAMKVLQDDQIIYSRPRDAAAAFDKLFMGFGTLAQNFPPPFDQTVGDFLYELGSSGFFGNMQQVMAGQNSNLGRAMYLRDNME